jgi:hypothetical protein
VVLLKVWSRRQNGTFAAACIVWVRPDGEEDKEGVHFGSVAAHEFGTAPMMARDRNNLSGINDNPPLPIPFVPVTMAYTLSEPRHPIAGRVAQTVKIPAIQLIVNATNEHGVQLVDADPPIQDLELNLRCMSESSIGLCLLMKKEVMMMMMKKKKKKRRRR